MLVRKIDWTQWELVIQLNSIGRVCFDFDALHVYNKFKFTYFINRLRLVEIFFNF